MRAPWGDSNNAINAATGGGRGGEGGGGGLDTTSEGWKGVFCNQQFVVSGL